MDKLDLIHALLGARDEIVRLRHDNEAMRGQVRVLDIFERALMGAPRAGSAGVDIAWVLKRAQEGLEAERDAERVKAEQHGEEK